MEPQRRSCWVPLSSVAAWSRVLLPRTPGLLLCKQVSSTHWLPRVNSGRIVPQFVVEFTGGVDSFVSFREGILSFLHTAGARNVLQ